MFASTVRRLHASHRVAGLSLSTPCCLHLRHGIGRQLPRLCAIKAGTTCVRASSTTTKKDEKPRYKYPEYLNVYRAGVVRTSFLGLMRVVTIVVFGAGCFFSPSFYFSPEYSNWWVPACVLGGAVPMVVMIFATGPMAQAIAIRLPVSARRSKQELKRFVEDVPADALVRIDCIPLVPWPRKRYVKFGRLRKYKVSMQRGLVNLESTPENEQKGKDTFWYSVAKRLKGTFFVNNDVPDKSSAPGLWKQIWGQIPVKGSREDVKRELNASRTWTPAVMSNRPHSATNTSARPIVRPHGSAR